jgi:hypothetical protein
MLTTCEPPEGCVISWQETKMRFNREQLLAEALLIRIRRFKKHPVRREWYELGFRDGWKAALTGEVTKAERDK